ncbi:glutathione S-transferase theta-1 [Leptinotarsa decemlineata]|uniref:glutathione S-transferase theta-1 n=1 Tax=Leptinotarsa decemlineata TaxID=7539 RepID=UPI000C251C1C|nr:glutathione S-transferase theta-1-like [Leptinotarsa decemlineata]
MVLKLFYDLHSQPSRALFMFLKLSKIPFQSCAVDLLRGEHLTKEFKKNYSKFQKVPFIHEDDFFLTESIGILRYLSRQYPIADHWYPKDSRKQAKVDELLEWQHLNIRLNCSTYFITKFTIPLKTGKDPVPEKVEKAKKYMVKSLSDFEELFLSGDGPFVFGDQISYADLQAACEIEQPRMVGYNPRDYFPKIKTWLENVRKECNPVYDEAHNIVNMIADDDDNLKAKL